jgi:hypothetical protein
MTAPTADIACQVYAGGTLLADTADEFLASVPTVLAGLSVTWGRNTIVDQPATTECAFTVRDKGGDADYLALLHTGHPVQIWASADLSSGDAPINIVVDGGFEDTTIPVANRATAAAGSATYATDVVHSGVRALRVDGHAAGAARVFIGPIPFTAAADGWDDTPKTLTGQAWTIQAAVRPATAAVTTVAPWLATSPVPGGGGTHVLAGGVVPPGGWQTYAQTWTVSAADPAGTWVGVAVILSGFVAWADWPGTWAAQTGSWQDLGTSVVDDVAILAPPVAQRTVLVFTGRITSLTLQSGGGGGVSVDVTAADWTADLANDAIGDNPWLAEKVSARVPRILALTGSGVTATIDPFPAGQTVSWVDVDSQPAMDLLSQLAISTDSVLWSAWHGSRGFYLWFEDPASRSALRVLAVDPDTGFIEIVTGTRPSNGIYLPSCSLALDPIQVVQDVSDIVTRVDVGWQDQTLNDDGQPDPTDRNYLVVDADAETEFGQRRVQVSTQLTTQAAAVVIGDRVLARSRGLGWRASGFEWDTRLPQEFTDANRRAAMDLLDGTLRIGAPLVIDDMPAWSPSGPVLVSYLEGGTYSYQGGRWTFDLNLSPSGQSGASTRWVDLPNTWTWRMFDPGLVWLDLLGTTVGTTTQETP